MKRLLVLFFIILPVLANAKNSYNIGIHVDMAAGFVNTVEFFRGERSLMLAAYGQNTVGAKEASIGAGTSRFFLKNKKTGEAKHFGPLISTMAGYTYSKIKDNYYSDTFSNPVSRDVINKTIWGNIDFGYRFFFFKHLYLDVLSGFFVRYEMANKDVAKIEIKPDLGFRFGVRF